MKRAEQAGRGLQPAQRPGDDALVHSPVITVERHKFGNTTRTVRMAPSMSDCCTLDTDA